MNLMMTAYHWILFFAFGICFISCSYHFFRILSLGLPKDYSKPLGKVGPAIAYSLTTAMSPLKKETAYLHFPTYTAGIIFHLGTFLSFAWLIISFFEFGLPQWMVYASSLFLVVSAICGISILIKRLTKASLKSLSNADDYVSNILVTGFQILSLANLMWDTFPVLAIFSTILFIYIPLGKLRHTVYFFTSRIHLGFFYGWRGVWPSGRRPE
ncbi:hypothetical protein ACFLTH_09300 [Bacteroidota bacterium]